MIIRRCSKLRRVPTHNLQMLGFRRHQSVCTITGALRELFVLASSNGLSLAIATSAVQSAFDAVKHKVVGCAEEVDYMMKIPSATTNAFSNNERHRLLNRHSQQEHPVSCGNSIGKCDMFDYQDISG